MTEEINNSEVVADTSNQLESKFDGGLLSLIGWNILGGLITFVTFGICLPWALCMIYKWKAEHTVISGKRLKFSGTGGALFITWLKWLFFIVITFGIYGLWVVIFVEKWKVKNTSFAVNGE